MSKAPSRYPFNNIDQNDPAVIKWMKQVIDRSESYKFIRMADDFHNVANYLNDIRVCFISVTITIYVVLVIMAIAFCVRSNRRNMSGATSARRPRSQWDYQIENQASDYRNPGQTDDLVSVRSDGQTALSQPTSAPSYMGRNHRGAPTFMRHGLQMNHSQTTRLVADHDGTVKHTIPSTANNGIAGNGGSSDNSRYDRGDRDRGGGGTTAGGGRDSSGAKGKDAITDM